MSSFFLSFFHSFNVSSFFLSFFLSSNVSSFFLILFFFSLGKTYNPDEDFNQNLSIIIISHSKIILVKHFCIQKKIEVETRWQINKLAGIFFFHFPFFFFFVRSVKYN